MIVVVGRQATASEHPRIRSSIYAPKGHYFLQQFLVKNAGLDVVSACNVSLLGSFGSVSCRRRCKVVDSVSLAILPVMIGTGLWLGSIPRTPPHGDLAQLADQFDGI